MKVHSLGLVIVALALTCACPAQAQSVRNRLEAIARATVRQPLNNNATVTRSTPAGNVTVSTNNTFNGTTGSFDTQVTLPSNATSSLTGSISVTPGSGASVNGTFTSPAGQSTSFNNTASFSGGSITVTSTVTPPSGNTVTRTNTFTPPEQKPEEENSFTALIKRLIAQFAQRK
jgi:hypothetical protein